MEEIEAAAKHFQASGDVRTIQPGRWYRLTGHFDSAKSGDNEFLITDATHSVSNNYETARRTCRIQQPPHLPA